MCLVSLRLQEGDNAVAVAAETGDLEIVKKLVRLGLSVNDRNLVSWSGVTKRSAVFAILERLYSTFLGAAERRHSRAGGISD